MLFLAQVSEFTEKAHEAAEAGQHVAAHAEHAEHSAPHVVNWVTLLAHAMGDTPASTFLLKNEKMIFTVIIASLIAFFCWVVNRRVSVNPGKLQLAMEGLVMWLDGLVCSVVGPQGRSSTPFVGALFIYILVQNLYGLVPLQSSATGALTTTAPLAFLVFFYVQWIGITKNGPIGYLYHLCGSPKDVIGWCLIPLMFPLHIVGEFAKPISLMFRLYGNVMAGHVLLAVFIGLGIGMLKPLHVPVGVPLHFPFLVLELLVGLIQAFVFALLSTVYIAMMMPHDHEEHHAPASHEAHPEKAHAH